MHRARLLSGIAVALLGTGVARAAEYRVDVAGDVDARGIANIREQVGPILFQQVLLQNLPTAGEIREADADDRARPKPVLVLANTGRGRAKLALKVQLEDDLDRVVLACSFSKLQGTGWNDLVDKICGGNETMLTIEWPRVRTVRVIGTIED